jgi:hypothetical protein
VAKLLEESVEHGVDGLAHGVFGYGEFGVHFDPHTTRSWTFATAFE